MKKVLIALGAVLFTALILQRVSAERAEALDVLTSLGTKRKSMERQGADLSEIDSLIARLHDDIDKSVELDEYHDYLQTKPKRRKLFKEKSVKKFDEWQSRHPDDDPELEYSDDPMYIP